MYLILTIDLLCLDVKNGYQVCSVISLADSIATDFDILTSKTISICMTLSEWTKEHPMWSQFVSKLRI